jgi:hypothetical protein
MKGIILCCYNTHPTGTIINLERLQFKIMFKITSFIQVECHKECDVSVSTINAGLTGCYPSTAHQIVEDMGLWPRRCCWK